MCSSDLGNGPDTIRTVSTIIAHLDVDSKILLMKGGFHKFSQGKSLALILLRKSTLRKPSRNLLQYLQSSMVKVAQSPVP